MFIWGLIFIGSFLGGGIGGLMVMLKSLTKRVTALEDRLRQIDQSETAKQD